jgi:hypothetical protein
MWRTACEAVFDLCCQGEGCAEGCAAGGSSFVPLCNDGGRGLFAQILRDPAARVAGDTNANAARACTQARVPLARTCIIGG